MSFNISSTFSSFVAFFVFSLIVSKRLFLFILWSTLFKKSLIKLLLFLEEPCNIFCNPKVLNRFSLYFNSNFRKVFVVDFKKYIKGTFVSQLFRVLIKLFHSIWLCSCLNSSICFSKICLIHWLTFFTNV